MRKFLLIPLVIVVVSGLILSGCAAPAPTPAPAPAPAPAPTEKIVLKAATFLPLTHPKSTWFKLLVDGVNERAKGELVIDWLGGPEVMGRFSTDMAVKEGVIDIGWHPSGKLTPEIRGPSYSLLSDDEINKSGIWEYLQELSNERGIYLLGTCGAPEPFQYVHTSKPFKTLKDMEGFRIPTETLLVKALPRLGMEVVVMEDKEVYTGIERGLVDGYIGMLSGVPSRSLHEVLTHTVDHSFYKHGTFTTINLEAWNGLPQHLKDIIIGVQREVMEPQSAILDRQQSAAARKKMEDAGMVFVKFPPADEEKWDTVITDENWVTFIKQVGEERGRKIVEMLSKP